MKNEVPLTQKNNQYKKQQSVLTVLVMHCVTGNGKWKFEPYLISEQK